VNLSWIDSSIVLGYFLLILAVGVWMERRAGKDLESYFLGGKTLPWWLLGMSGSSTFFDITGTMWMVSVFYLLGMRGMWEHWFWGFPLAGFFMAYRAKWSYRSGVLTGMEWMAFRYGEGPDGKAARLTAVGLSLLSIVFMLGYAGTGVGKFLEEFLPFDRKWTVPLLFGFTGLYVVLGGFFSVVYTDFFQTVLLTITAVTIAGAAFLHIDPQSFQNQVGPDWYRLDPVWRIPNQPSEYPDPFGLLVLLWFSKGLITLFAASGGAAEFQRFRAARNEGEACKVGFAWGIVISVRWALVMGFTAYGLSILVQNGEAVDSESVLPMVLNRVLPVGVKGLVLAGLLAAFMSSFDSTLNVAASFIVNDLVKPRWKSATEKQLLRISYLATIGVVVLGILISLKTERIAAIWNPINFALGSAMIAPSLLAAYWWRISGWSLCASAVCTLPAALCIKLYTDWRELQYFPVLLAISLGVTLLASFLLPGTPRENLLDFYVKVRPFGFWGPIRKELAQHGLPSQRPRRDRRDIPVALIGTAFFVALYILMMDLVVHYWVRVAWLAPLTLALGIILYFYWWRRLPQTDLTDCPEED
jgi:Na+/proline symporter